MPGSEVLDADGDGPYWYDCRYTYKPTGQGTGWQSFTTTGVTPIPQRNQDEGALGEADKAYPGDCPASLPADGLVVQVSLNGGDAGTVDTGLAGAFDDVAIATSNGTQMFDFEPARGVTEEDGG